MASVSDEIPPPTQGNEVESPSSENKLPTENEEVKPDEDKVEQVKEEDQEQPLTTTSVEPEEESQPDKPTPTASNIQEEQPLTSSSLEEVNKENIGRKPQKQESSTSKSRSVNFASTVDDAEVPKSRSTNSTNSRSSHSSSRSSRRGPDFIDALVESYKLETSGNTAPIIEEKKYVPKTNRSRLNPNWREHRTRRLMNKLEELSLWDREEELKASQAQSLREQKWEQIQDRQRNHDLCLNLMRQRHESEMESAVILDRGASAVNDENTTATIARAMNITSPANLLQYDLPTPPHSLKRRVKQEEEKEFKTPIGRYRQFETTMNNKIDKINQKLQPDHEIMRAYSPYRTSIPPTAVPLFSETYSALLSVPDTYSTNKYNQYHYGVASHLHQPQHAPSPDYEARLQSYSNRDVRVPLKEQANDYSYYDDDNNNNTNEYSRSNLMDEDRYTKYRSNPIENDYYTKYRSTPLDDDRYTKYRSNPIDEDYHPKYRSNPADDYPSKYRSNPIDEDYHTKYRSNPVVDDDYSSIYRPTPSVDDDYYTKYRSTLSSKLDYSPPRRTTSLASPTASALYDYSTVANTPREFSFLHSRLPTSNSIHLRSLNDDLNAITRFSTETSKKILHDVGDSPNDSLTKTRSSSSIPSTRHVNFNNQDVDDENISYKNSSRNSSSKTTYQPIEILSLSSTR